MKTVLIMSRGRRLAPMFKVMAQELAKNYRVIVAINTIYQDLESHFWNDIKGVTLIDFYGEIHRRTNNGGTISRKVIKDIENEIQVSLYRSTSNYQLYRRLFNEYYPHGNWGSFYTNEEEIIKEYVGSYLVLSDIFQKYAPDLIFYETVDLISTFVALSLGYNNQRFCLGFDFAPGFDDPRVVLSYGIHRQNIILNTLFASPSLLPASSRTGAAELISRFKNYGSPWYVKGYKQEVGKRYVPSAKKILQYLAEKQFLINPLVPVHRLRDKLWLERNARRIIPEEPFIAFFLQHQPEAASCTYAPRWVDQDGVIEQLAINAPYGMKVLIKENPRTYGYRARNYFGPLLDLPNVYMCHPSVNSYEVAKRSEAIVAIIGSIGLEGIFMQKRVAVLGRPYYCIFPGVKRLNYPEEIFSALQDRSWQPETMTEELENFTAAYIESVYDFGPVSDGQVWPTPEVGGRRLAQAVQKSLAFIEEHGLSPRDFDPGISY